MYCVLHDIYTSLLSYERHTECVLVPEPKLHQKFTQRHTNTQIKSHKDCQCWITVKLLEVAFSFAANLFTFCSRKFTIKSIKSSTLLKLKVWLIGSCYQFLSVKWFTSKIIITSRAPFRFHFVWDWDETHCFCEKSNEISKSNLGVSSIFNLFINRTRVAESINCVQFASFQVLSLRYRLYDSVCISFVCPFHTLCSSIHESRFKLRHFSHLFLFTHIRCLCVAQWFRSRHIIQTSHV